MKAADAPESRAWRDVHVSLAFRSVHNDNEAPTVSISVTIESELVEVRVTDNDNGVPEMDCAVSRDCFDLDGRCLGWLVD